MAQIGFQPGEIDQLVKEFYAIGGNIVRARSGILTASSKILVNEIKSNAPVGSKIHKRYGTPKAIKSRRAKKGSGVVVATYYPGNLRFSFKVMKFSRAKASVYVGSKLAKGQAQGVFSSAAKADGYYSHMVDRGTKNKAARPFVERSVLAVQNDVLEDIKKRTAKYIKRKGK